MAKVKMDFSDIRPKRSKFGKTVPKSMKCAVDKGYILIYVEGGRPVLQHRYKVEQALGRPLKRSEVVHHINGIKQDNRNCNLLVCSRKYHRELHERCYNRFGSWHLPLKDA